MNRDEVRKLIGGYATGTLTEEERKLLFDAALDDQDLFDELAAEQPLKELLETPGVRTRLTAALEPAESQAGETAMSWWTRPWAWAGAAGLACAGIVAVVLLRAPAPVEIAQVKESAPVADQFAPPAEPSPVSAAKPIAGVAGRAVRAVEPAPPPTVTAPATEASRDQESDRRVQELEKKEVAATPVASPPSQPPQIQQQQAPAAPVQSQQVAVGGQQQAQGQVAFAAQEPQAKVSQSSQQGLTQQAVQQNVQLAAAAESQRKDQGPGVNDSVTVSAETALLRTAPARAKAATVVRTAFSYTIAAREVRVTPAADGFLQMATRGDVQSVVSPPRRVNRGTESALAIPEGARSVVLTFAVRETALAGQTRAPAARRERSAVVAFPDASTESVSVEIPLQ